ncbi:calcium uniporter protein 2, mitochondrial-like [Glycine soja]|uniref:Calcium uniporter protein 2, mitochondrial isoform B n=1 Tax=Glycine soja TaxID=3848 RepID=A0A445HXU1_GLYSO|nr:calcium uniporter protein 2, mitochondrial-like [Glycine soja]RZB78638.1 Calcium uniporter protein 2, mitochondrial isoform B [Glycine soja]
MAFRKTLAQGLLNITKVSSQSLTNCRISSSSVIGKVSPRAAEPVDPGENGRFRSPQLAGRNLLDKLRTMGVAHNRIRLDGLTPPQIKMVDTVTIEDARKLLKVAQVEMLKAKLRQTRKSCITFSEFIAICAEHCSDQDQAVEIAKMLDNSAAVIVLGDVVFLRPEQVAKAIQGLLPVPGAKVPESIRREFEEMEKKRLTIDDRADTMVRRELWGGLGFMMVQTMAFMRLTFWELSWDVMEPICFYLTSMYCMACYTFFLRTSKEPSFEGFYQARFSSKQKRLMKLHNFDIEKYNQLRAACSPTTMPPKFDPSMALPFDNSSIHQ